MIKRIYRIAKWLIWNKWLRYINWHYAKYGHSGLFYYND